jgi:3D (Asp-Asp-Asp) domain-containing protein
MKNINQQKAELIILTALMLGIAVIGISSRVEAYEGEQRQDSLYLIKNTISHRQDKNVSNEIDEISEREANPLCSLDAVICPDEKQGTIREISAYNSVSEQTDASPCISADGTDICQRYKKGECIVATNAYPLKTKLRIDKIGDCTVADRMNRRYTNRIDVFMDKDIDRAIHFGLQNLSVIEL